MHSLLPSIRELEIGLQDITEPLSDRERHAVRIARALLSYVRNFGTPEQRPASAKVAAQTLGVYQTGTPAHLMRPRGQPLMVDVSGSTLHAMQPRTRQSVKTRQAVQPKPACGVTLKQLSARTGWSGPYLSKLLWHGILPRPAFASRGGGVASMWTDAQAAEIEAIMADPARRKVPGIQPEPVPANWVSAQEFAKRIGYARVNSLHHLVSSGRAPAAEFKRGRCNYWSEETVAAALVRIKGGNV